MQIGEERAERVVERERVPRGPSGRGEQHGKKRESGHGAGISIARPRDRSTDVPGRTLHRVAGSAEPRCAHVVAAELPQRVADEAPDDFLPPVDVEVGVVERLRARGDLRGSLGDRLVGHPHAPREVLGAEAQLAHLALLLLDAQQTLGGIDPSDPLLVTQWHVTIETGTGDGMAEAHRLYTRSGFAARGPFSDYPDSQWYKDSYTLLQSGGLQPRENQGSWLSKAGALITGS